jgi:hypothetical protein
MGASDQPSSFRSLWFHALGCAAQVRYQADPNSWPERLVDLMGVEAYREAPAKEPRVSITVIPSQREGFWRVRQHGHPPAQPFVWFHEDALLREVEWQLYATSAAESTVSLLIHAGAVVRDSATLLLPGSSGAGKTTLTYALAARGWWTLTDDLLALDTTSDYPASELQALACERCGHVSPQTLDLLAKEGVELEGPVAGLTEYYRPREWAEPAPVRYVIAPQYHPGATTAMRPLTQAETAALLMKASFAQRRIQYQQQWQAAVRVAGQTRGWWLTYGSLNDALDMVDHLTAAR